ncbi:MAG: hypothetical protein ACP5O1_05705 [Phycisphaerae bacterium]
MTRNRIWIALLITTALLSGLMRARGDSLTPDALSLLPAQWKASSLAPNLDTEQRRPAHVFAGFKPVYSHHDWRQFSAKYGAGEKKLLMELDSQRNVFAGHLLTRAAATHRNGYARLLALRAFAETFQHTSGSPLAVKALHTYLRHLAPDDINNPVLVAPIWTMAHELAWLGATPYAVRSQMAVVAEKANVQLAMDLLRVGQYTAAKEIIAQLPILETNRVRRNALLMSQMGTLRALTRQSIVEINFVGSQMPLVDQNAQAAMYVLLHAAYVQPQPSLIRQIIRHWPHSVVYELGELLLAKKPTPTQQYRRAQLIIAACHGLGRSILRDRSFYAALNDLIAFRQAKSTQWDRIHRALAKITIAHLIERFALPNPHVDPLAPLVGCPTTTASASTTPAG